MTMQPPSASAPYTRSVQRLLAVLALLLAVAFAVAEVHGARQAYSPVPFWDMWNGYLGFYMDAQDHTSAWWAQHNEHRIVLSRLLFWADLRWLRGTGLPLVIINHLLALALFGLLALMAWRGTNAPRAVRATLAIALTTLAFAWTQKNNLTWGFQSQFFLAYLLPLVALLLLGRSGEKGPKRGWLFAAALACGVLSAGSMANGVLALPLLAVVTIATRQSAARILAVFGLAISVVALYFHGYAPPSGHDSLMHSLLGSPLGTIRFVLAYLGGPFAYVRGDAASGLGIATVCGVFVAVAMLVLVARVVLRRELPLDRYTALAAYLCYVGASAFAVAGGRQSMGLENAVSSRYTTPALSALATVLVLLATCAGRDRPRITRMAAITAVLVVLALLPEQLRALRPSPYENFEKLTAALATELRVRDEPQLAWIFPSPDWLFQIAAPAARQDLSIFGDPRIHDAAESIGGHPLLEAHDCGGVGPAPQPIAANVTARKVQGAFMAPSLPDGVRKLYIIDADGRTVGRGLVAPPDNAGSGMQGAPFRAYILADGRPPLAAYAPDSGCRIALQAEPAAQPAPAAATP